ncbi:protein unzipped [Halyomorpha halys]|uniref:protein unzipped n=1 Tax=Halyomorpha halys TaxID=286706 RepID=UPI0006D51F05|nr:protein unzipped [Halyomorpha halys]
MMIIQKCAIVISILVTYVEAFSENSVYLKSSDVFMNKLVTSSTLRWITAEKGSHPETAVVGTVETVKNELDGLFQRNIFICRAKHIGMGKWVPGQLKTGSGGCLISQHDKVETYEKYEVLENVEGGARLSWGKWSKLSDVPVGAVSAGESYVARKKIKMDDTDTESLGVTHLIGKLTDYSGFAKLTAVNEEGKEQDFTEGEILIETEPIRYELTNIKFTTINNNKKAVKKQPIDLGKTTLENIQNISGKVDMVIGFDANSSVYWGQGKAMLKGLTTVIRNSTSNHLEEIKWGISEDENRQNVHKVEMFLHPGTAVNVTLKGIITETETPYTAKLIAIYQDGAHRARTIQGIHQEIKMTDVKPEFSDVFFTGNFSLVPTTTTTTTTTTTLVPTTLQLTTESSSISTNEISKINEDGKREKTMMNDEGSRLNATNKTISTGGNNTASSLNYGYSLVITLFLVTLWRKQI